MCLSALLSKEEKIKFLKNKPKTIIGYKVFAIEATENKMAELYAITFNQYHFKWNKNALSEEDKNYFFTDDGEILYELGFHLFANETAAKKSAKFLQHIINKDSNPFNFFLNKTLVVLPITFKQKDIIEIGEQRYNKKTKNQKTCYGKKIPEPALSYVVREFNVPMPEITLIDE